MAMTPEQAKKLGELRIRRKKEKIKKERDLGEKKKSHDWHSEFVYTGMLGHLYKNAGHWTVSHCKRCGLPYFRFKAMPQSCEEVMTPNVCETKEEQCSEAPQLINIKG